MNGSRTSFNYDPSSYAAKRLLNLAEETSHEDNSVISENPVYISEAMRENSRARRPSIPETTSSSITRANSEISLYTPMRRRSLLTPGIATREVRTDPSSSRGRTRYSLPSTPARRESIDSTGVGAIGFPRPMTSSDPIPRALTPSEADYKQTGAFKLGTLRITNGSPTRSPARSPTHKPSDGIQDKSSDKYPVDEPTGDYFGTTQLAPTSSFNAESSSLTVHQTEVQKSENYLSPTGDLSPEVVVPGYYSQPQISSQLLPEYRLSPSPLVEGKLTIPQIQVTSKHTAAEDMLFEDEQNEYSSVEVLDVRVDTNAKSLPPRPKLTSEGRDSKEISRSDSGVVASPASEYSHAPLSKADSGYSSSVSLRSFSSRPPVPEKDRTSDIEVEVMSNAGTQQSVGMDSDIMSSPTSVSSAELLHKTTPPPVPMKDPYVVTLGSPKASGEQSPFQQNFRLPSTPNRNHVPQRVLSPSSNSWHHSGGIVKSQRAFLLDPTATASNRSSLSISSGFRKSGKLQRFLSGGRAQLTVHSTHPIESTNVPAISRDMQVKLHSHARMSPISFRRLALKSAASKETLGTILSVGSAELLQDDDIPSNKSSSQLIQKPITPISIVSAIVQTTSPTFAKKPIPRKPVPVRNKDANVVTEATQTQPSTRKSPEGNDMLQLTSRHSTSGAIYGSIRSTTSNERLRYSVPAPRLARSNTMTGNIRSDLGTIHAGTGHSYELALDKSHPTTSLELPPVGPTVKLSKSPPPVSMRTRNMGPLRVPPPTRPQSTPPESMERPGRPPYSRRGSREGSFMNPEATGNIAPDHTMISIRSSRENLHSYPPAHAYRYTSPPPAASVANNTRPMSVGMDAPKLARRPSWEVQADHGPSLSRRPSSDYSRRSSLASQSSRQSSATTGPSFSRPQYYSHPNLPSLKNHSSYGDDFIPQDTLIRDNGPYPSISRNGQSVVTDPTSGRSMSMTPEWDQPMQHPPHGPRHHYRHRSMDQYGNPMPYRVLHSYNSPAYRNVPIWR